MSDTATLMINSAHAMRAALVPFHGVFLDRQAEPSEEEEEDDGILTSSANGALSDWSERLEGTVAEWLERLVEEEAGSVLEQSGLLGLLEKARASAQGSVLSELPGLSTTNVEAVMRAFYASLFALVMPSFEKLGTTQPLVA